MLAARRLARDEEARLARKAVLDVPLRLVSLAACMDAADDLVGAAKEETEAATEALDGAETDALKNSLGVGARGPGVVAASRGAAGQLKDLEKRQKSRATRIGRDSLDRALVDLAGFYRDVLALQADAGVELVNEEMRDAVAGVARSSTPEATLRRIDAILAARNAIDVNVAPLLAVEAMTVSLRRG